MTFYINPTDQIDPTDNNPFRNPYAKSNNPPKKPKKTRNMERMERRERMEREPNYIDNQNSSPSQHIKMSIRLPKGIVTSITLKKNIVTLWVLYTIDPNNPVELFKDIKEVKSITDIPNLIKKSIQERAEIGKRLPKNASLDVKRNLKKNLTSSELVLNKIQERISAKITDFVYGSLNKWDNSTGKGLSDFVTELMIKDFLEDYPLYTILLTQIK